MILVKAAQSCVCAASLCSRKYHAANEGFILNLTSWFSTVMLLVYAIAETALLLEMGLEKLFWAPRRIRSPDRHEPSLSRGKVQPWGWELTLGFGCELNA